MKGIARSYFDQAVEDAKRYRDQVIEPEPEPQNPYVRVTTMIPGPEGKLVPCGEATFPRCEADEFETGVLTITSIDDGYVMQDYQPGQWKEAVAYDAFGHLSYMRIADLRTGTATP